MFPNRQLERPRRRWEDSIRFELQEVGCGGMNWFDLAEDRDTWRALVNAVMNLRKGKGKGHPITGHQGPRGRVEV
jgi:hypothetical protein